MTQEEIKTNFSNNLVRLRKAKNLTQLQLAEKLNYSDKAISKWEVGSVIPDVETLTNIADFFGITVNDLIYKQKKGILKKLYANHLFVSLLSSGLVWFLATIIYFVLSVSTSIPRLWLTFIFAIPVSFVVLVVFTFLWFKTLHQYLSITGLFWGIIVSVYLGINNPKLWFIFIIGVVGQVLITLMFMWKRTNAKK